MGSRITRTLQLVKNMSSLEREPMTGSKNTRELMDKNTSRALTSAIFSRGTEHRLTGGSGCKRELELPVVIVDPITWLLVIGVYMGKPSHTSTGNSFQVRAVLV